MQEERLEQAGATQQQQQQLSKAEEVVGDRAAVAASASTTVSVSTSAVDSQQAAASVPAVKAIAPVPPHDLAPLHPEPLQTVQGKDKSAVTEPEPVAKEDKVRMHSLFYLINIHIYNTGQLFFHRRNKS